MSKCYSQINVSREKAAVLRQKGFNENLPAVYRVHAMEPYIQVHMDKITHTWDSLSGRLELDFRHFFGPIVDLDKPVAAPGAVGGDLDRHRALPVVRDDFSDAVETLKADVIKKFGAPYTHSNPHTGPGGDNPRQRT